MAKKIYTGRMLEQVNENISILKTEMETMSINMNSMVVSMSEMLNVSSMAINTIRVMPSDTKQSMALDVKGHGDVFKSGCEGTCKFKINNDSLSLTAKMQRGTGSTPVDVKLAIRLQIIVNGIPHTLAYGESEVMTFSSNQSRVATVTIDNFSLTELVTLATDDEISFSVTYPVVGAGSFTISEEIPNANAFDFNVGVYAVGKPQTPAYMIYDV